MKYTYILDIGDWSDDGHGKCEELLFESNMRIDAVRGAYFKAAKKLGYRLDGHGSDFCTDYTCNSFSRKGLAKIRESGYKGAFSDDPREDYVTTHGMAKLVIWFCMQGNPKLELKLVDKPPSFAFFGFDKKKRHIGHIGYGLFC